MVTFRDCALAFRFSAIDKLYEPPSVPAMKGTAVHRALELLFCEPPPRRTPAVAATCLAAALDETAADPRFDELSLDENGIQEFRRDAERMVRRYFEVEDPATVRPVGLELKMAAEVNGVLVRGIIDRLEFDADGRLVVTDYKTGRTPSLMGEQQKLVGVHMYSLLCEQMLGVRPAVVQLMYLGSRPELILARPTEQSTRGVRNRIAAVWSAIERACETEDFRPKPGPLCNWCAFTAYCPAFGGTPPPAPKATDDDAAGAEEPYRGEEG